MNHNDTKEIWNSFMQRIVNQIPQEPPQEPPQETPRETLQEPTYEQEPPQVNDISPSEQLNNEQNLEDNDGSDEDTQNQHKFIEIVCKSTHICGKFTDCDYKYVDVLEEKDEKSGLKWRKMNRVPNPDFKDGKCENYGKPQDAIIHIASYDDKYLKDEKILNQSEIVIKDKKIKIEFDYPLNGTFYFDFVSKKGYTRKQLIAAICDTYRKIYQEEYDTAENNKIVDQERTGLLNRPSTNGKYGVWGHDIGDLMIEGIYYYPRERTVKLA
ncbi:MAG: hypothetical protein WD512_16160, partial [Candidatus Paceibacterota bacterium]